MTNGASIAQEPDVYGQKHAVETRQLVKKKLHAFDAEVARRTKVLTSENESLIQATERCPELLTNSFKLMFLRCEVFDVQLAVARYIKYWAKRVVIFGQTKAFQPLTLEGALADDKAALETGYVRLVHGVTDMKGRAILMGDSSRLDRSKYTRESMVRAVWYIIHAALESDSAQKHGVVLIGDPSKAKLSQMDRKLLKMILPSVLGALPLRTSGFHVCNAPMAISSVFYPFLKLFLADRITKRVFFHSGAESKLLESLQMYGLDKSCVPTQVGGRVELRHEDWLQDRRRRGL